MAKKNKKKLGRNHKAQKKSTRTSFTPSVAGVVDPQPAPQKDMFAQDSLLESCRTQWQYGEWDALLQLTTEDISRDRDRGKLAALLASVNGQAGQIEKSKAFAAHALEWGCDKAMLSRLMVSAAINTLGRAASAVGEEELAENRFRDAIAIVEPHADTRLLGRTRQVRETARMGLLPMAQKMIEADLAAAGTDPGRHETRLKTLARDVEVLKSELSSAQHAPSMVSSLGGPRVKNSTEASYNSIRSLHHFACTGGTILSKCISLMPDVTFLSEIDPLSRLTRQGGNGPHKFQPSDIIYGAALLAHRPISQRETLDVFVASVRTLRDCLNDRGSVLVIRDHAPSHFCSRTDIASRPTLRTILEQVGPTLSAVSVRHPLDSFLSILANEWEHFVPFTLDEYARRYDLFLDAYQGMPLIYFEDFIADPNTVLETLCAALEIPFVPNIYDNIGAMEMSGDSGRRSEEISARPRRAVPDAVAREAAQSHTYKALCHRLGYSPDINLPIAAPTDMQRTVPGQVLTAH